MGLRVGTRDVWLRPMALISSASPASAGAGKDAGKKKGGGLKTAQALAKQKAIEKKAKTIRVPVSF